MPRSANGDAAPSYPWSLQCIQPLIIHDICYHCLCVMVFNHNSFLKSLHVLPIASRSTSRQVFEGGVRCELYGHIQSANLFGQNLGKSGSHGSGTEESFFRQMRGNFQTLSRNFQEHLGKRSGTAGGGEGTTNVCAFTWRVKMHNDISLRSWMIFNPC